MDRLYYDYKPLWQCFNPSGKLAVMTKTVISYLDGQKFEIDAYGNLLVGDFSKERPCIVAHLDSVHDVKSNKYFIKQGRIASDNGIGGDDKCGVIAALELLKYNDDINAIFTLDEEVGCIGASRVEDSKLDNVKYFIEVDRRGGSDIIYQSGMDTLASPEFIEAVTPYADKFHYKEDIGTLTDLNELCYKAEKSGFNLSAGYYNAHTNKEYVNLVELQRAINFCQAVLNQLDDTYKLDVYYDYGYNKFNSKGVDRNLEEVLTEAYYNDLDQYTIDLIVEAYEIGKSDAELFCEHRYNGLGHDKSGNFNVIT